MRWLGLVLASVCGFGVLGGCGGPVCDAGDSKLCVCTSGNMGAQSCSSGGESWGACMCDGDGSSGAPGAMDSDPEPSGMATDSGGMSGGSMGGSDVADPAPTGCGEPTCPFVSVWRLENDDESITLGMPESQWISQMPESQVINGEEVPFQYNFQVDWGDGSPPATVNSFDDADGYHLYVQAGQYTVTITGVMESIDFSAGECDKLVEIPDLGSVGWKSLRSAFGGCSNLGRVIGGDTSSVTSMDEMFWGADSANPDTSSWDTSNVTSMRYMFANAPSANPDVSNWDTSSVTNMQGMFAGSAADRDTLDWWAEQCARPEVCCEAGPRCF